MTDNRSLRIRVREPDGTATTSYVSSYGGTGNDSVTFWTLFKLLEAINENLYTLATVLEAINDVDVQPPTKG